MTLPELQQDFRDLWREVDLGISTSGNRNRVTIEIRENLRDLYHTLSQDTHNASTTLPPADTNLNGHPPDPPAPMYSDDENARTDTTTFPPALPHDASLTSASPHPNAPVPGPPELADDVSPDDATAMQRITEVAAPLTTEPVETHGAPTASQVIVTGGGGTDISSRDQSTLRPNPGRSFRADSPSHFDFGVVSSAYIPHGVESPPPAPTAAPSHATPLAASVPDPTPSSYAPGEPVS